MLIFAPLNHFMKKILPLALLVFTIVFSSCQKEVDYPEIDAVNPDNALLGSWNLVNITVKGTTEVIAVENGSTARNIGYNDYTTINNTGQLKFEPSKMTGNLSYSVNTTFRTDYFLNGALVNSVNMPLSMDIPPTNSSGNYIRVGSDSLHFPNGTFLSFDNSGTGSQSEAAGMRYKIEGNKLTLIQKVNQVEKFTLGGGSQTSKITLDVRAFFQR